MTQGTVATFSPDTNTGTVLLDDGAVLPFDANAFATSGLRLLRFGQRLNLRVQDGKVTALTHASVPLP